MDYRCTVCRKGTEAFSLLCPWCGAWLTLKGGEEETPGALARPLNEVMLPSVDPWKTHLRHIDELLGGGFVGGSSVLLTGAPGSGKSTLLLQLLDASGRSALYVSGEEGAEQIKLRANRLHIDTDAIAVVFETNIRPVALCARKRPPGFLVIDSIQTMYTDLSDALPGTTTQIRKCGYILRRLAQEKGLVLIIVGQVTKGLKAAGPKALEHAVDTVLSLSLQKGHPAERVLLVSKNRFGPAGCPLPLRMAAGGFLLERG